MARGAKKDKGNVLRWLNPEGIAWGTEPTDYDPDLIRELLPRVGRIFGERRYFGLTADGFDRLPEPPVMLVSNHSGGTTIPDVWGFGYAWYRHFGVERPLHFAAHEMVLGNQYTGPFFSRVGVVRADRKLAREVLAEHRRDLLVLPGGDLDTWRPFSERYNVRFSGRTGYARLAILAGVPIVPVAHVGAHHTLLVLSDGRRIAKALRFPELFRASIFPIHFSLPFGLTIGPWPHIPFPSHLRYLVGEPIHPPEGSVPGEEPDRRHVRELDRQVREAIQELLTKLQADRAQGRRRLFDRLW